MLIQNTKKMEQPWLHVFLYGNSGAGKTEIASTFPAPLFLVPYNESSHITLMGRDFDYVVIGMDQKGRKMPARQHLVQVLSELEKRYNQAIRAETDEEADELFPWQTIVWESLTHYSDLVVEEIVEKSGKGQVDQRGWGELAAHLRAVHARLRALQVHVVITALSKITEGESGITEGQPAISGSMATKLPAACDVTGYCEVVRGKDNATVYRTHFRRYGKYPARARFKDFPAYIDNFSFKHLEKHCRLR